MPTLINRAHISPTELRSIRKMLYLGLVIAAVIVVFHSIANDFALYWIIKWLDNPVHIFGGMLAGYFTLFGWIVFRYIQFFRTRKVEDEHAIAPEIIKSISLKTALRVSIIGALVVGILWELLEFSYGLSGFSSDFRFDTTMDLINDMIGGILIALLVFWFLLKNKHTK